MECHNVCKVWKELLSRQSYRQIEKKLLKEKEEKVEELCEASSKGDLDKVKHLISMGVKINSERPATKRPIGMYYTSYTTVTGTPLYYAAMNGQKNVVINC